MLNTARCKKRVALKLITLLFPISVITFHSFVFAADIKESSAEEYRLKGYEAQQKGDFGEALTNYSKTIALGLDNAIVLNDMGVLHEELGTNDRAEKFYLQAIKRDKNYLPPYINLAYLYQRGGQPEKAYQYFRIRYELGIPGDPWTDKAWQEMVKIHPEVKKLSLQKDAQILSEELVNKAHQEFYNQVERAQEHYQTGLKLASQRKYREALGEYHQALSLTPKSSKILKARDKAILELTKQDVKNYSQQAMKSLNAGDTSSAKQEIQKMLTTIPNRSLISK